VATRGQDALDSPSRKQQARLVVADLDRFKGSKNSVSVAPPLSPTAKTSPDCSHEKALLKHAFRHPRSARSVLHDPGFRARMPSDNLPGTCPCSSNRIHRQDDRRQSSRYPHLQGADIALRRRRTGAGGAPGPVPRFRVSIGHLSPLGSGIATRLAGFPRVWPSRTAPSRFQIWCARPGSEPQVCIIRLPLRSVR